MKMSEILRDLADKLGRIEQGANQEHLIPVDLVDQEEPSPESNKMIPPLQAKLEILKKSEGLPNAYDNQSDDELDMLKTRAGLSAVRIEASEDNDVVG